MAPEEAGNRDELNIRAGGEEETGKGLLGDYEFFIALPEGGEGDTPHGGLDCLSFCLLKIARLGAGGW